MNDIQVECLFAAVEAESFSKAASQLYLSKASFGRHISSLERELDVCLFERNAVPVRLTEAGCIVYEALERSRRYFSDALSQAQDVSAGVSGHLAIGVLAGQSMTLVFRNVFAEFQQAYPSIDIDFRESYGGLIRDLRAGEIDLALTVRANIVGEKDVSAIGIEELETYFVMPVDHPLASCANPRLSDFRHETFITSRQNMIGVISDYFSCGEGDLSFSPSVLVAPDITTQMLWLEAGWGISLANKYHAMCNSPLLAKVRMPEISNGMLCVAYNGTCEPSGPTRRFIDALRLLPNLLAACEFE